MPQNPISEISQGDRFEPEPISEPPLQRASVIDHGVHRVHSSSREVLEAKLATLPDKMLFALAGVSDDDAG